MYGINFDANLFDQLLQNLQNHHENQHGGQYNLIGTFDSINKKYRVHQKRLEFRCPNEQFENFLDVGASIEEFFQSIYDDYIREVEGNKLIRLVVIHDVFETPISTNLIKKSDFRLADFLKLLDGVCQSRKRIPNNQVQPNHHLKVSLFIVDPIEGGVSKKRKIDKNISNINDLLKTSSSTIRVTNRDNLCLVRSFIIGKAIADKEKNWNNLERNNCRELKIRVEKLVDELGLPTNQLLGLDHVKIIDTHFQDYQITIYETDRDNEPIYYDNQKSKNKKIKFINLLYHQSHFDVIKSMLLFYNCYYYCLFCKKRFTRLGNHKCDKTCTACFRLNCLKNIEKKCKTCGVSCANSSCYDHHVQQFCLKKQYCLTCNYVKNKNHVCIDEKWCNNCKKAVDLEHKCFIQTVDLNVKKPKKFKGFVFFDFECYAEPITGYHVVNLAMAQKVCINCIECKERCSLCKKQICFYTIEDFVDWMLKKENDYFTFIAHNAKGYDSYMIIKELQKKKLPGDPNITANVNGTKVLYFRFRKFEIKDSSLFIPMRLEEFSKAFGLKELKKGYFPHLFNKPENQSYIGSYPQKYYYGYEYMSNAKQKEFDKFYESNKDNTFDFKKEFETYCWSDVQLLTEGCLLFSKLNKEDTKINDRDLGVCPFQEKTTLASFCNFLYTRNFMASNTIGLLPAYGFNPKSNMSHECELWLKYISFRDNIQILHAKNGGEKKIGRYFVDGFCQSNKTIYEFYGCAFHGCNMCYGTSTFNPICQVLNSTLRQRTASRIEEIQKLLPDFKICDIWEHDWNKAKKENDNLKRFINNEQLATPLEPRDSLYGGRTNALKLYHCCKSDEKIKYIDYTSLYPYVQKYGEYPIRHPIILTEHLDSNTRYFGLIKCKILPPRDLYIPVLPVRVNNKLLFPLCGSCARDQITECEHNEDQRALEGTWCTLETDEAVRYGYKILKIFEVWHWAERAQYDRINKTEGIFEKYVDQALKEKQEASGFPESCKSEEEKDAYIQDYLAHEGILLDKSKIEKNPGRRQVAKLKANSLWGYFAMNTNRKSFKIITKPSEWFEMLTNDRYIIHDFNADSENFIQVQYSEKKEYHFGGLTTNVVIASFVTCQARLKLFREIHKLDKRVLYFDTDSIFFISKPGHYEPELGEYLGDFTNEIDPKEGNFITEFVSAGPKNYAYKLDTGLTDCVVKGITFNSLASLKINFDSIKDLVCRAQKQVLQVPQLKFKRTRDDWNVETIIQPKQYRFVYDKRIILQDLTTLPFGFKLL